MNLSDLKLNTFKRGDQVAPHKPLLILLALSRLQMGEPRLLTYQELEPDLKELLTRFSNSAPNPQYPFWRLRGDMGGKLWDIPRADDLHPNKSGDVSPKDLIDLNIKAGLTSDRSAATDSECLTTHNRYSESRETNEGMHAGSVFILSAIWIASVYIFLLRASSFKILETITSL